MTPEQKAILDARRAKLIDVLCDEADPEKFATMDTRDGRGDRQWQKSNAIKTATLIMRIEDLIGLRGAGAGWQAPPKDRDEDGDAEGASAGPSEVDRLIAEANGKVQRIAPEKKKAGGKG